MADDEDLLQVENVTKQFGGLTAVDDVSFGVSDGELRAVIGPNGAGKSTLFNVITGFLKPTDGRIVFDSTDVTDQPPHERCQMGISRSFQINEIFESLTVRENLRIAAQGKHENRTHPLKNTDTMELVIETATTVLDRIKLTEQADTVAKNLAYGDQRKLEIGLVLASDPELLLFDEPTAGVGAEESHEFENLIETVTADRTVLLIEHDIDVIMNIADRISVLHEGRLIAEGPPEDIAQNDDVQEAYLGGTI